MRIELDCKLTFQGNLLVMSTLIWLRFEKKAMIAKIITGWITMMRIVSVKVDFGKREPVTDQLEEED